MSAPAKALVLVAAVAAVAGAAELCASFGDALPQQAADGDVLSVAFSDAREELASALVHRADSYFHGGIDFDCHAAHGHAHEHGEHDHDHDDIDGHEQDGGWFDPWEWFDSRVRAPSVHRHLEGSETMELMPWLWAGVRADPRNVANWTTAWYVASHMAKDHALAREILAEARRANPESMELAFTAGCEAYDGGRGDAAAAETLFLEAKALGERSCGGDLSRLSEHDSQIYQFILGYLRKIEEDRLAGAAGTPSAQNF
ncbi:MAG: hypothetical protein IKC15_06700 [Kiritimatiellae bacterium]|nr:hypothetical protein [Kiritimatiellia bacterium]